MNDNKLLQSIKQKDEQAIGILMTKYSRLLGKLQVISYAKSVLMPTQKKLLPTYLSAYEEPSVVEIPVDNPDNNKTTDETLTITRPGHKGLDIVCDKGTPVYPVLEGNVIDTGYNSGYGNYILIQHQDGYTSKYAHLESILVEQGQDVSIETQIGTVGSTGMSTGPHLHLEMTYNDELIDPSPFMFNQNSETTPAY